MNAKRDCLRERESISVGLRHLVAEVAFVDRVSKGRAGGDAFLALERVLLRIADAGAAARMPATSS